MDYHFNSKESYFLKHFVKKKLFKNNDFTSNLSKMNLQKQHVTLNITKSHPQTITLYPLGREEEHNKFHISIPYQSDDLENHIYNVATLAIINSYI